MRRTSKVFAPGALAMLALLSLAGCGEAPPPEGFHLKLRFTSLDPNVLETVRVTFDPMGVDQRFMAMEPISYADGNIDVSIDPDGVVVMLIDGPYLASVAEMQPDGAYIFDLEVWSDDERVRAPAPFVRVVGNRGGEAIAQGDSFLPSWPLQNGGEVVVQVPCRMAVSDRCF